MGEADVETKPSQEGVETNGASAEVHHGSPSSPDSDEPPTSTSSPNTSNKKFRVVANNIIAANRISGEALHDSRWRPVNSCEYADTYYICMCGLLIDFECAALMID